MTQIAKIRAILWDFGGVFTTSPFERFREYEVAHGLPQDFIRSINAHNPSHNAWAQLERNDITPDQFDALFEKESAARGHPLKGREVLALLKGTLRPSMVKALRRVKALGYQTGCITNNFLPLDPSAADKHMMAGSDKESENMRAVMEMFDCVVESSLAGIRKPDPRIYHMACEKLGIQPNEAVYLDDLGVNLKPARAMGMKTIKVVKPEDAIGALEKILEESLQ